MQQNHEDEENSKSKILEKDLCYKIIGCMMKVANKYGNGLKESIIQNAAVEGLEKEGLKVELQKRINIYSLDTGKLLGTYVPDAIVEDKVVLEFKATDFTTQRDINQQRPYLKASKNEIGYLINFGT